MSFPPGVGEDVQRIVGIVIRNGVNPKFGKSTPTKDPEP